MIKIDHISFSYGEENENTGGVRDIDLNIEDGQFVVLCVFGNYIHYDAAFPRHYDGGLSAFFNLSQ